MTKNTRPIKGRSRIRLQPHEEETIAFLRERGFRVKIIPRSKQPGIRTPDFLIGDLYWETKALFQTSTSTIEHAFKNASKQAENTIFDLRHLKASDDHKQISALVHLFHSSKRIKRMMIITKQNQLLKYNC